MCWRSRSACLLWRQRPSVDAEPGAIILGATMLAFVAWPAERSHRAEPELSVIATVRFDVVDNLSGLGQTLLEAVLAKRLAGELMAAQSAPAAMIIRAASIVSGIVPQHVPDAGAGGVLAQDLSSRAGTCRCHSDPSFKIVTDILPLCRGRNG
jgi:hypothetical protein